MVFAVPRKRREAPLDNGSAEAFKRMRPVDRVRLAVEMSSVVSAITLQSILDRNPGISKRRLIAEARKRLMLGRRPR